MNIQSDIPTYNKNASIWLESLLRINYGIELSLGAYQLFRSEDSFHIDLQDYSNETLFRNIILLINSYPEYLAQDNDRYGRLPYEASFQAKHHKLPTNIVQEMIERFVANHGQSIEPRPSQIILSHDIDTLHHGGIYELNRGLKEGNLSLIGSVLLATLTSTPIWQNIPEIIATLADYGYPSTFFFIPQSGTSSDGIKNADYTVSKGFGLKNIELVHQHGHSIGLHKSTMPVEINEEYALLPPYSKPINRYHYLRFDLPTAYRTLSASDIMMDTSLCFPYHIGFRNSYGLPFKPFDLEYGHTLDILEIPFQIMDRMFVPKHFDRPHSTWHELKSFLDAHHTNAVLGALWHNTELSKVSNQKNHRLFLQLLEYIRSSNIEVTTPEEIYQRYGKKWT